MKKTAFVLTFILAFLSVTLSAQDQPGKVKKSHGKSSKEEIDEKEKENKVIRWNFGINIGGYWANPYPAKFYDGEDYNPNKVSYVMSNYYWYQDIKNALGASDTVIVTEYPEDINYKLAMMFGLFLRYNFNLNWGVALDVNYTQLKAEDVVTFQVDPMTFLTFPDYRYIPIRGIEQRAHLDLMFQRNFRLKNRMYVFLQGGLNLNYTHVQQSSIYVENREYSMINVYGSQIYVPGLPMQEYTVTQGGVGYGGMVAAGIGIPLVDMFGIEPGFMFNYNNVAIEGYNEFRPSFGFYLRLLFGNIVPRPDPE
jgi:hypothetical protein